MLGVTRQYAGKIVREMEEKGLVESWYDIRRTPPVRVYRMRVDRIDFTDGYMEYTFAAGFLGGIEVRLPKDRRPKPAEAGEDSREPSEGETPEADSPHT